jgi:hypothetical protein
MSVTYAHILNYLQQMDEEELLQTATVYDSDADEFKAIEQVDVTDDTCGVLDPGHVVFCIL